LLLDLDELDVVFRGRWLWSVGSRNLAEFRRADYLGPIELPLREAVCRSVEQATGVRPDGPIRLLTHVRYAGHIFNPVSFYYCYASDGTTLQCVVAEITNTPWQERHAYVLPLEQALKEGRALKWTFDKSFHVSPFVPMNRAYEWRLTAPADELQVHMDVLNQGQSEFQATLDLRRLPLSAAALRRVLWRFPLMTCQVVWGIYWQALRLWAKGNPVYRHPRAAGESQ
jgi:DUF1365 family protein